MDIYGRNLHLISCLTGGFVFQRNDLYPNIIKSIVLLVVASVLFCDFYFHFKRLGNIIFACSIALFVLLVKIIVLYLNYLLDSSVDVPYEDFEEELQQIELPRGVSAQLWERRRVLFNNNIPADDRASFLIDEGFDPDEVFTLYQCIERGEINEQTEIGAPMRRIKTSLILINGITINIKLDRETLSRTFSRPDNWIETIASVIITFIFVYSQRYLFVIQISQKTWIMILMCCISALFIFSLLLPPLCDPYSTILNDSTIGFTRAIVGICFCAAVPASRFLYENKILFDSENQLNDIQTFIAVFYIFIPIIIFVGYIGQPITTIHWIMESINKYIFATAGSSSLIRCLIDCIVSLAILSINVLIIIAHDGPSVKIFAVFNISFLIQFCYEDFSIIRLKKVLLRRAFISIASAIFSLIAYFAVQKLDVFYNYAICILHLTLDIIIPYLLSYEKYWIFHGRVITPNRYVDMVRQYYRFITVPFYISYIIFHFEAHPVIEILLILQSFRFSNTLPFLFAYSLVISIITFQYEFMVENEAIAMFASMIITRKLLKVYRATRLLFKSNMFVDKIYSDPYTETTRFLTAAFSMLFTSFVPKGNYPITLNAYVWSIVTGAPSSYYHGSGIFLTPSSPRPNCFFDASSTSMNYEGFKHIETNHAFEIPVYESMTRAFEERLCTMIQNGELGLVPDDSFFLFTENDLVCILHIISIEPSCVRFQVRGLEYVQQTICHNGELSILQQIILEHDDFGNIGHTIVFMFSIFNLIEKELPLNMISVTQFNFVETVLSIIGVQDVMMWFFRAVAYVVLVKFPQETNNEDNQEEEEIEFTKEQLDFIHLLKEEPSKQELKLINEIWQRVLNSVQIEHGEDTFTDTNLIKLFEGKEEDLLTHSIRYGIVFSLNESVGMAPSIDDVEDFRSYLDEVSEDPIIPIKSPLLYQTVSETKGTVISLINFNDKINIVRFSNSTTNWSVFKLDNETVRGFWANEARCILFEAYTSKERPSIQFHLKYLRNIINSSCDQPIGYPVLESYVNTSVS